MGLKPRRAAPVADVIAEDDPWRDLWVRRVFPSGATWTVAYPVLSCHVYLTQPAAAAGPVVAAIRRYLELVGPDCLTQLFGGRAYTRLTTARLERELVALAA